MDAGWTRTCQKAPEAWDHSPACQSLVLPCLGSSRPRRACSGHCRMRACVVDAGSPALPALPAWSPACPAMCSSPAPAPSPPAHCPPAASTSTPTHPAGHPAPSQPLAMASQRRNVSLGFGGRRSPGAGGRHLVVVCGQALRRGRGVQVLQRILLGHLNLEEISPCPPPKDRFLRPRLPSYYAVSASLLPPKRLIS